MHTLNNGDQEHRQELMEAVSTLLPSPSLPSLSSPPFLRFPFLKSKAP